MSHWRQVAQLLHEPHCQGVGNIHLVCERDFYDETALPYSFAGGGTVCHLIPRDGFAKEALAGSEDEKLLVVDCPDEPGWLVCEDIVRDWMARNVHCPALEDLLLSHPLYEYLTKPDEEGRSRGGRAVLVHWSPGFPNLASLYPPEFLPEDDEAPKVNRDRATYAKALVDLLEKVEASFPMVEIEVGLRYGRGAPWPSRDALDAAVEPPS